MPDKRQKPGEKKAAPRRGGLPAHLRKGAEARVESGPERLQKVLARAGVASRRAAEEMIAGGRVRVNGAIGATVPGRAQEMVYIVLNKPVGVVTTVRDPQGRKTVLQMLEGAKLSERGLRLFPVGRLDVDSTGLLLLTNDGDLTFRLTHPRYGVEKEYRALVRGHPSPSSLQRLREGVEIEGEMTAPAKAVEVGRKEGNTWLRITIHEGRKRQVRLMAAAIGHQVIELQRVRFGPLVLGDLDEGKWRYLATHEVHALRKAVKLKPAVR
jgi:pseudouridine synthase